MEKRKHVSVTLGKDAPIKLASHLVNDAKGILDAQLEKIKRYLTENEYKAALELADKVIEKSDDSYPNLYLAYFYKGQAFKKLGDDDFSENCYRQSIQLNPEYSAAHNDLAIVLKSKKDFPGAEKHYLKAIRLDPTDYKAYLNFASFYMMTKRRQRAQIMVREALRLNPDYPLAKQLFDILINKNELIDLLENKVKNNPGQAEGKVFCDLALLYEYQKKYDQAFFYFDQAVTSVYKISVFFFQHFATLARELKKYDSVEILKQALNEYPGNYQFYNQLAVSLLRKDRLLEANLFFRKSLEIEPSQYAALHDLGLSYTLLKYYQKCIDTEKKCISLKPDYISAYGNIIVSAQEMADWNVVDEYFPIMKKYIDQFLSSGRVIAWRPFLALSLPITPREYNDIARSRHTYDQEKRVYTSYNINRSKKAKIRIGYISSDFTTRHPVGFLIEELFSFHDSSRFETFAYSLQPASNRNSERIQKSFDHYKLLINVSDEEVAKEIHNDGINILIDLVGYTKGIRHEVLAAQPAPLQVHYLGYTASLQADYIQYFITSKEVVPKKLEKYFNEKLIFMPEGTYATTLRELPNVDLQRKDFNLPEDQVVFCCFSSITRINRLVFTAWMSILNSVPGSVLWLRDENEEMKKNLCDFAKSQGVDSKQLVFIKYKYLTDQWHHQLADLWLDNFTMSAGTGAVLAANVGLPVLTLAGDTPQSRVGAGVAVSADSSKMICSSVEEYTKMAISLAKDRDKLVALKDDLLKKRDEMPLFNPKHFIAHLESAYQKIWQNYLKEKELKSITIKKLS